MDGIISCRKDRLNAMNKTNEMIRRRNDLLIQMRNILAIGFVYYILSSITGLYIPCAFRMITGYKCPGCGITHLAVAMLHGNFHEAFTANQLIFIMLPVAIIYGGYRAYKYIKCGSRGFSGPETVMLFITLVVTIAFGIYRNI